jgi:hypothetical protein
MKEVMHRVFEKIHSDEKFSHAFVMVELKMICALRVMNVFAFYFGYRSRAI